MRERTPSADDTPKRAPPAPPREAASTDVAGSKTSSEAEGFRAAKFSSSTTASPTATATTTASSPSSVDVRMVASTHSLDDLGVSHPASASADRQQQQEKHAHTYRSAQTAQDKRSRLSNVINNLRKKVPDSRSGDSPRKEEDDRNSVERNLETLEKYVMTVLNGVIKDEEEDDREVGRKSETEKGKDKKLPEDQEDEDSKGPAAKFEPSKPNESRTEAAVFLSEHSEKADSLLGSSAVKECLEYEKLVEKNESLQKADESTCLEEKQSREDPSDDLSEGDKSCKTEAVGEVSESNKCSREKPEDQCTQETAQSESHEEERKENKSLGTIIMERLSDHQSEDKGNNDVGKEEAREFVSENSELRNVCRDLLNDLLNGINQLIDENSQEKEEGRTLDDPSEETKESKSQDLSMTSLHCSLPLDKVASVLQNCQTNELTVPQSPSSSSSSSSSQGSKSPSKPPSPTVRHLCLYCDRKFSSISLRQRHTERVHQQGGGRRSERNSRKPSQNCQYCTDKCAESLEGLFQHMVGTHGDKYHACVQCSTRYLTREALAGHMSENHGVNVERNLQIQEKIKEPSSCKELTTQSSRDRAEPPSPKDKKLEDSDHGVLEHRAESILLKPAIAPPKDTFSNPGSPEFDSSFYSSVSCNIRENLLHHLDGKLQSSSSSVAPATSSVVDSKPQQQQTFYEHNVNQIQFPIDISLTAATPVYSKEYTNEEYENSSEYAQKPGKSNRSHPRRVSFEKYNFPRKYDGKEQWTCSIKDLSKFDISTQLTLRKKQQLLKECVTLNRRHQIPILGPFETTDIAQDEQNAGSKQPAESGNVEEAFSGRNNTEVEQASRCDAASSAEPKTEAAELKSLQATEFSAEFGNFLRLRKWDEKAFNDTVKKQEVVYAELTGEWSRPRVYICGACASKHVTLREMEDHKASLHPNVWCSHFEFSGDQRELYKHLFLPGRNMPTAKAKTAVLAEKVCTKCSRNCNTLPELHRHMLECGGDQAWLLGLFGNGKKKCKWRPFGSRSRRRRQRGMKRNIQNSQTPRVNTPKEKQPTGPRVRPSDRESIQKMLANLPPKRATRKVMQDSTLRAQGRLRNVQTRSRPRMVGDNTTASRMSRNKAALRNKLLKNAKSIQRNRCRIDNISAVIESVVKSYNAEEKKSQDGKSDEEKSDVKKDAKEKGEESGRKETVIDEKSARTKFRGPRVLSKKRNVKTKEGTLRTEDQPRKMGHMKAKVKSVSKNALETKSHILEETSDTPKSVKVSPKGTEKEADEVSPATSPEELKSPSPSAKNKLFVQTTPKRKRPVDPVASLNASIKAKSQLRTQDGKFARNPNKSLSPQKSPELRPPIAGRQWIKGRSNETSPEPSVTRSKFRAVSRSKNDDQLPKRNTRLSSDSDKMPTLEPAVQVTSSNEEYVDTAVNDLPILSPATSSSSSEKTLRGRNLVSKNLEDKDSLKKGSENEEVDGKNEVAGDREEDREQKQGKTRRMKGDGKNLEKSLKNIAGKADVSKEKPKSIMKEKLKRKSAPGRIPSAEERKASGSKSPEDTRKELKQKKEDGGMKTLETRGNSKTKLDKILDADGQIKIQNVPFEVKKLIGSDNKEDLLTTLVLTSRTASSKRCLRQTAPKANLEQGKSKALTDSEADKASLDSELGSTSSTGSGKRDTGFRRKSLRNTEKKVEDKITPKDDKSIAEEANKMRNAANEIKTVIRGRRSNSLSGENKSVISATQVSASESQNKAEAEFTVQNADNENSSNKRQTRGSVLNSEADVQGKETSSEQHNVSLEKSSHLGKRRGRIKSNNDVPDKNNSEVSQGKNEESVKNNSTEITDKINTVEDNKTNSVDKEVTIPEDNVPRDKEEKDKNVVKADQMEDASVKSAETPNASLSLNHLQLETSSSMDSGKENSLETVVGVQKLKVGRPRKSWGSRRERTSKRSLNNVIGILTEGMNIPVESQQSVVLTVQTTLDNASSDEAVQNNAQQSDDGSSRSVNLDKTDKTPETANVIDDMVEEARSCVQTEEVSKQLQTVDVSVKDLNMEDPLANTQKVDSSSSDIKERSPTTDIILDLSRRKTKGKGSFLEKIVSKIAKQKDALLEGEVGSLLDTAADELTSILDEVGPGLSETTENLADLKNEVNKTKIEEKAQGSAHEVNEKSVDKDFSLTNNSSDKKLENRDSSINKSEAVGNEEKKATLKEGESPKEIINDSESINQKEIKDERLAQLNQEITDRQTEISDVRKDADFDNLKLADRIAPVENNFTVSNGVLLSISEGVSDSALNCSAQICLTKQDDELVKRDDEAVIEGSKSKKKSKKRSLEGSSPKKNKRKTVEPEEESEENLIPKELHFADIMKLIDKSKQVPFTKETAEDAETDIERVQPGKRKPENSDPAAKDLIDNKISEHIQICEDSTNGAKKIKIDLQKDAKESAEANQEDKIVTGKYSVEDLVNESNDKIYINNVEVQPPLMQIAGKRRSSVEPVEQSPETDISVKRTSKRRSVLEEKATQLSEEEMLAKVVLSATETMLGTSRRRSSRTKSTIQQKNEEKSKETLDDFASDISNAVVAQNSELPLNTAVDKDEFLKNDASLVQTTVVAATEETNKVEENSTPNTIKSQEARKDGVIERVPETVLDAPIIPKVAKKRGRKKKVLANEQAQITNDSSKENSTSKIEADPVEGKPAVPSEILGRKSLRTSRSTEEIEKESKNSNSTTTSHIPSPSMEHFKIPEVTDVLQHTKKRTSKKKSVTDEHLDTQSVLPSVESEANSVEYSEISKTFAEKEERSENKEETGIGKKRLSRNSDREKLELERSSSSGSIDFAQSNRTRSSKRKQLSSEDILSREGLNHRAESVDSLSETSVVSESCYFRKKRFSKKKKGFQAPPEDVQTDTSITDSESIDTERNTDRRQSLKRRAKKNISFFELQFDLVDDFDISMDIEECLQPEEKLKDESREVESKSSQVEDKVDNETALNDIPDREREEDKTVADPKQTVEAEEEEGSEEAENTDVKADTTPEAPEDFQTPKKRAAGNFVVVHKKTGEILIVEKRKKLTKEAARFFCDVCATSFTRKSSLKKHNLSQSHLLQLAKFRKDKAFSESIEDACNASWKEASDQNETSNEEDRSVTELMNMSEESREEQKDLKSDSKDLEADRNISNTRVSIEQESFIASQTTHQRIVEDELLDEEICKITENMSHDEYVLTEHTSPGPESSSTPINMESKVIEDATKKKKHDKKKEKAKKKNLIDEHLALEIPDPKSPLNLTSGSLISVLGSNMSIKISKSSHLGTPEFPASKAQIIECTENVSLLGDSSNNLESSTDVSALKEVSFQEKCSNSPDVVLPRKNQNFDMELESVIESIEQAKERSMEVGLDKDLSEMVKLIPNNISDDKIVSKENQPQERISLKLTINKRSLGQFNEANIEINRGLDLNCSQKSEDIKSLSSYGSQKQNEYTADTNYLNLKTTDLISTLSKSLEEESKINLDNAIRDSNVSKEMLQPIDILKTLEKVGVEASQIVQNNSYDKQTPLVTENIIEDIPGLQNESHRVPRHSKSKKNKAKKHVEEIENVSADSLVTRKTSKSKGNQHRQHLDEVVKPSGSAKNEESRKCSETFECKVVDKTVNKKSEIVENNSDKVNNLAGFTGPETEAKHGFSALDILENQRNNEHRQTTMAGEKQDKIDSESKTKCQITFEEDGNSLSSIEDKPLSQVLLKVGEILREDRKQKRDRNASVNSLECPKESKLEDKQSKATFDFVENAMINNQPDSSELTNGEQVALQIPYEEEDKSEPLSSVKTSDKDAEASLESENSEAIRQIKRISSEKEAKTTSNDRKSSGKKVSKSHKHSSKESHRKIRNKKTSLKSKIADLVSESDDSEYEDKIESQNKSKIVKSVFGRVFGSEKADKVKEVLNDWVSKSEDDSDLSRTDFKSFSPNSLKTKEVSEAKSAERNAEKQTASSVLTSSKKSGKKSKKNSSLDRGKEKNLEPEDQEDLRSDKHTESQSNSSNCRKNNVDMELLHRRHCAGEILPPTSHRSSKKKAKKRISEELLSFDTFFDRMEGKFNWGSKSEDDSDLSRSESKPSTPDELKAREILEARTQHDMERQSNASPTSSSKKRSGKKSKRGSLEKTKEKDSMSESQEDHRSDKGAVVKNSSSDRKRNDTDTEDDVSEITSPTTNRSSKKKAKKRLSDSQLPHGTSFERMERKYTWGSNSEDDSDASKTEFKHSGPGASKIRESVEARSEEKDMEKQSASCVSTSLRKSAKKSKKSSSSDRAKEKNLVAESQEDSRSDKHTESQNNVHNRKKSNADMELLFRQHCVDETLPPTSCRSNKKKTKKRMSKDPLSLGSLFERMESKFNWGSKSEDDSDNDESFSPSELKIREIAETKNEKDMERQSSSSITSSPKKRSGKKSRKSSSSDKTKEKNSVSENLEDHRANKHGEPKNSLTNRKKNDVNAEVDMGEILPSTCYRNSKKRAEEKISKSFLPLDYIYESKESSELKNQRSDLSVKDSGYGSFNCDEDSSKLVSLETSEEKNPKVTKKRKSDDLAVEKKTTKNSKESDNEDGSSVKGLPRGENLANVLSVDLESSRSCSSLAPSSVRNRSPSMDRNSQTTKDSDIDEDGDEEDMAHRRISPLFICGTPRSSIDSSSNSENEEENEKVSAGGTAACKRSSSEFSGEKIVIRSPSSTHKSEVVTITPTDAIEDNALDVPQEIEISKPRQGKVLNFDEELFVECCSRLKATTENELRGAKKIKLDHSEGYHKKDDQQDGFKGPKDRWRDVESQNSLGSLLESVNQLLGEEMYSTRERDYPKRRRNVRSEYSSRSASPDMSRADNLGYEDSLDVAFEHNNKLRDKIQQRIRESESLIASTFGQKGRNEIVDDDKHPAKADEQETHLQDQEHLSRTNLSNRDYNDGLHVRGLQEQQSPKKANLESSGFKNRMNSALGGLLDKALSNLLHSNGKNDHNGSTPMKVLAELACARAPTSTAGDSASQEDIESAKTSPSKDSVPNPAPLTISKDLQKKTRNPIKELFERKKEMNERKQQEKSKTEEALKELNAHRQRKTKKAKKHQDFPLIRRNEHGGLVERKRRRDGFDRKDEFVTDRIKDVYEFDEEESQMEPNLGSVMSYRSRPGYEVNCLKTKEVDVAELMSKAIGDSLENGKAGDPLSTRLESIIDRKFKELEKFAPKTKGALKAFQSEEQRHVTGPMDEFVERKQSQSKRPPEQNLKHPKLKKRNRNPKKKNRNAWYENDSSDEYRTAVKAEGVGVGISKSQRTCSKGKQNIFAELYTSSESEFENEGLDYEAKRQKKVKKSTKKIHELENVEQDQELSNKYCSENEDRVDEWRDPDLKDDANKNDCDNKKSESEMSDHPLVIDERKDIDDQRNSDEETENPYEGNFGLDDLYREDSSVADSDVEESTATKAETVSVESKVKSSNVPEEKLDGKVDYIQEDELIPLEEALDLLDQADTNLEMKYDNVNKEAKLVEHVDTIEPVETLDKAFDSIEESTEKCPGSVDDQEEEPDNDLLSLPEKLSTNEKPQKESDNLPLHVFLSRKVQESKKRKEQQLKKMQEEQERILMDFQPTRRQRKCAIGKQGLLAEISSSDEEMSPRDSRKSGDRSDHEKPRKQKRESKEKRKERYIEKKHEQMIAKEQKAIEEEILRELGKKKESLAQNATDFSAAKESEIMNEAQEIIPPEQMQKKKHQAKEKQKKPVKLDEDTCVKSTNEGLDDLQKKIHSETNHRSENNQDLPGKQKKHSKSPTKAKKSPKGDTKTATGKKGKNPGSDKSKSRADSKGSKDKECKSTNNKRDSDDEELKTTKSWNKVEEGVGVAIGRRKRAAANQLYYWSSSSDEEEMLEVAPVVEEEEDDRQEQHGWIVGDSHKKMITMLAMEKQLKEKRRRSEDEFEPSKAKSKKHRNSTS